MTKSSKGLHIVIVAASVIFVLFDGVSFGAALPQDDPIRNRYGFAYPWTEDIRWDNVRSILAFPGKSWDEKLSTAQNSLSAEGGGIVYFPRGVYKFLDSIYLRDGVILRGEFVNGETEARVPGFLPSTVLEFPKPGKFGNYKITSLKPDSDSFIGLVDLSIKYADIDLTTTLDTPSGGTNRLVYGVSSSNSIRVETSENALIANNRASAGLIINRPDIPGSSISNPDVLLHKGIAIRDNYAYSVKQPAIAFSGELPDAENNAAPESMIDAAGRGILLKQNTAKTITVTDVIGLGCQEGTIENNTVDSSIIVEAAERVDGLAIRDNRLGNGGEIRIKTLSEAGWYPVQGLDIRSNRLGTNGSIVISGIPDESDIYLVGNRSQDGTIVNTLDPDTVYADNTGFLPPIVSGPLLVKELSPTSVSISFKYSARGNIKGYVLEKCLPRKGGGDTWVPIDRFDGLGSSGNVVHKVLGLTPNTRYQLRLRVIGDGGTSIPSKPLTITTPADAEDAPPEIAFEQDDREAHYKEGESALLTVRASDRDGRVTKVEYYADGMLLPQGSVEVTPFTYRWSNLPIGDFLVEAVAYDELGCTSNYQIGLSVGRNKAPRVVEAFYDMELTSSKASDLDLSKVFIDDDNDKLAYSVENSNPGAATVSISASTMKIIPKKPGITTVKVTASDGKRRIGKEAKLEFKVAYLPPVNIEVKRELPENRLEEIEIKEADPRN